jgi:ABC-type uncharacterized transport system permease subunit
MENSISFIAAAFYLVCPFIPNRHHRVVLGLTAIAWLVHGAALLLTVFSNEGLRVGFAVMWSTALWVSIMIYLFENKKFPIDSLKILVLPQASLVCILHWYFPGKVISLDDKTTMFPWHVCVAILAYSSLTMAAFHALVMYVQDWHLHHMKARAKRTWLSAALDRLPALLKMESILFRLILVGFVFLSLTVFSGIVFSEQVFGFAFRVDHKTVLTILSWFAFAALLVGRQWRGWRGKTVLRLTLFAFLALLLAYVGSRFVFEVVLQRSLV